MNKSFVVAARLLKEGWAAVRLDNKGEFVEGAVTLCPNFFVAQCEVDTDILVDPDIALENLAISVESFVNENLHIHVPENIPQDIMTKSP